MKLNISLIKSTLVAALGGFLFGFDTAVIAGVTSAVQEIFNLSDSMLGFTVASALIGTFIGALAVGKPGDTYGRRACLKLMGLLFFVSAAGCAIAWDLYSLVFFRFLGGLGVGGASVLGPMYIAEISPARWRGRLVMLFQFNVVIGVLSAYFSNFIVGLFDLGLYEWRWKLGIEALPAALFFLMLYFIPRSPRWLVKRQKVDEAREVLVSIGEENVEDELQEIIKSIYTPGGRTDEPLFQKKYSMPIFLAVSIAFFNQVSGINGILYYLNDIFSAAGFGKLSSDLQAVAIGATNLVFTIVAMSTIDRVGRKKLLLIGSVGTALSLAGVAVIFLLNQYQQYLVVLLISFIGFFGLSQGAVIWVYISEVFPNRVRAKGQSIGTFTHWFMCAVVSWTFPVFAKNYGGYTFVLFSLMIVAQFFVVLFVYPETKGITLEQLQKKLGIQDETIDAETTGS
ncbi:MAG TPA: sugar porter family MFS transporter [archaeon]|nr:sugar porter family MFS transporter [archaeon]